MLVKSVLFLHFADIWHSASEAPSKMSEGPDHWNCSSDEATSLLFWALYNVFFIPLASSSTPCVFSLFVQFAPVKFCHMTKDRSVRNIYAQFRRRLKISPRTRHDFHLFLEKHGADFQRFGCSWYLLKGLRVIMLQVVGNVAILT